MPIHQDEVSNGLLKNLPAAEFELIQSDLQWTDLVLRDVVQPAKSQITRGVFPVDGLISLLAVTDGGVRIEVGIVGREGFVGVPLIHDVDRAPYLAIVQVLGRAVTISADNLMAAMTKSSQLRTNLLRFAHVFEVQISQTALSNGSFTIDRRLARWLLMCEDRVNSTEFRITHEFLSAMLAVRRSGVTVALQDLEGKKIIKSSRGKVEVLDRRLLLELADGAYGVPEAEYKRLIG